MSHEAAIPGAKVSGEQWQTICCRYYTASQYVDRKQVLEVGCGAGLGLGYLGRTAKNVIGGDYSKDNLKYAHQHYWDRIKLLLLDVHELPFEDGCLDVMIAMEVIHYLTRLDDFFKECHRILRNGGILCLCLPNKDVPSFHRSPLSHRYYSVPELFTLLNHYDFDAEIFGAFPISRRPAWERVRATAIVTAGKVLGMMPKGKEVKEYLNQIVLGKTIVTKPELDDSDMIAENYKLEPVPAGFPDHRYRILYAIAYAR